MKTSHERLAEALRALLDVADAGEHDKLNALLHVAAEQSVAMAREDGETESDLREALQSAKAGH